MLEYTAAGRNSIRATPKQSKNRNPSLGWQGGSVDHRRQCADKTLIFLERADSFLLSNIGKATLHIHSGMDWMKFQYPSRPKADNRISV